jgi:hypothetical protein
MKPHLRLVAIHSKEFAPLSSLQALFREGATRGPLETELFSFEISIVAPEHALRELASTSHCLDGIILCCDLTGALSSSLGLVLSFAHAASIPVLSILMLFRQGDWIETFESQLREYIATSGIAADEIPFHTFAAFSFSNPPLEWLSALTEAAQQRAMRRWSSRKNGALRAIVIDRQQQSYCFGVLRGDIQTTNSYEPFLYQAEPITIKSCDDEWRGADEINSAPISQKERASFERSVWCQVSPDVPLPIYSFIGERGTLPEIRQIVARIYSLPTSAKPLFAPPQNERPITIHRSFGLVDVREVKAKMCLIPPTQTMQPGAEAAALITFARTLPKENGVIIRSFFREAPGLASSWFVGDCFRWGCEEMMGVGVAVRVID